MEENLSNYDSHVTLSKIKLSDKDRPDLASKYCIMLVDDKNRQRHCGKAAINVCWGWEEPYTKILPCHNGWCKQHESSIPP